MALMAYNTANTPVVTLSIGEGKMAQIAMSVGRKFARTASALKWGTTRITRIIFAKGNVRKRWRVTPEEEARFGRFSLSVKENYNTEWKCYP